MGALVSYRAPAAPVDPGTEGTGVVTVQNTAAAAGEFTIDVVGPARSWTVVEPAVLSLAPGEEGAALVRFRPPLDATVAAGPYPLDIRVRSGEGAWAGEVAAGLDVGPCADCEVAVEPGADPGDGWSSYDVRLANTGNVALAARLAVVDAGPSRVRFAPERLEVAPGAVAGSEVQVRRPGPLGALLAPPPVRIRLELDRGPAEVVTLAGAPNATVGRALARSAAVAGALVLLIAVAVLAQRRPPATRTGSLVVPSATTASTAAPPAEDAAPADDTVTTDPALADPGADAGGSPEEPSTTARPVAGEVARVALAAQEPPATAPGGVGPSGGRIVFADSAGQLYLVAGEGPVALNQQGRTPTLSPDGQTVVFSRVVANGRTALFSMAATPGATAAPIDLPGARNDRWPVFFRNGDEVRVAFWREEPGSGGLGRIISARPDGTAFQQSAVADVPDARFSAAGPGPDGWEPARIKVAHGTPDGNLRVITLDRGAALVLDLGGQESEPALSSDGRRIAFWSNRGSEAGDLYLADLSGATATRLTRAPNAEHLPSWSWDGRWVAYVRDGHVDAISTVDFRTIQLFGPGDDVGTAAWSQ